MNMTPFVKKALTILAVVAFAALSVTVTKVKAAEEVTTRPGVSLYQNTSVAFGGKTLLGFGTGLTYSGLGLGAYKIAGSNTSNYKHGFGIEGRLIPADFISNALPVRAYLDVGSMGATSPSAKNVYLLSIGGGLECRIPVPSNKVLQSWSLGAGYHNQRGLVLSAGGQF